jgi:hypothetical protein
MASNWRLPTWDEAQREVIKGTDDALSRFIYHNEPAVPDEEIIWRNQLQELIDFMLENRS